MTNPTPQPQTDEIPAPRITTHVIHNGRGREQFWVEIDGAPLIGSRGHYSRFYSRQEAKQEALRRLGLPHNKDLNRSKP
jgi:hypothetical protein